jgi:hypothetical protein
MRWLPGDIPLPDGCAARTALPDRIVNRDCSRGRGSRTEMVGRDRRARRDYCRNGAPGGRALLPNTGQHSPK